MVEVTAKLKIRRSAYKVDVKGQLALPFEARRNAQQVAKLASGEEVALKLPRGEVLRGGDLVTASDGRVIEVVAAPEKLLHVEGAALPRIAYILGNGHIPVQFGDGFMRVADVADLEPALREHGLKVSRVEEPFEPEVVGGHAHEPHEHHHEHDHGHDHDHDHGHHHHH
jgi:urease accessory protein